MTKKTIVSVTIAFVVAVAGGGARLVIARTGSGHLASPGYLFDDSHVHLTNYIQEGTGIADMLSVMGDKVGRATLFGIPVQQMWSYRIDRDSAPLYYLDSDAPLYYYSFTDAYIAMAYRSLTKEQQARFDPMITGFNPADMYAADHVRRVLQTFPGVFEGIGEFSLHKEFVTSKVATDPPSLSDPALDRLFSLAEEAGLVVLVHCDVDTPFPRTGMEPAYYAPLTKLFRRHPNATIVWAHLGLGRVVRPLGDQGRYVVSILEDAKLGHVMFDLSWSETAKYIVATPASVQLVAEIITKYPDRFLFGTDEVAPDNENDYLRVYRQYQPLWERLPADVRAQVLHGNYERIFDDARKRVRRWEQLHPAVTNQREPIVHRATGPD